MQRFAFPPQIRPAWKRQKSKNMVACEASLFRSAKFGKKIQLSQKINHYHTSEAAESRFSLPTNHKNAIIVRWFGNACLEGATETGAKSSVEANVMFLPGRQYACGNL